MNNDWQQEKLTDQAVTNRNSTHRHQIKRYQGWLWLMLLIAVFLRLHQLPHVPPGLTHDEADHGLSAWGVVQGERPLYFTVGYGREPLYDYSSAFLMQFLGPTYLANRLTAVFFGLIMLVGMLTWSQKAFDKPTALLTGAGLAVSFWPVMASRQALRSITLPALFVLVVLLFCWPSAKTGAMGTLVGGDLFWRSGFGFGATFYTYIPARVMWLLFPLTLLYWALAKMAAAPLYLAGYRGHVVGGWFCWLASFLVICTPIPTLKFASTS